MKQLPVVLLVLLVVLTLGCASTSKDNASPVAVIVQPGPDVSPSTAAQLQNALADQLHGTTAAQPLKVTVELGAGYVASPARVEVRSAPRYPVQMGNEAPNVTGNPPTSSGVSDSRDLGSSWLTTGSVAGRYTIADASGRILDRGPVYMAPSASPLEAVRGMAAGIARAVQRVARSSASVAPPINVVVTGDGVAPAEIQRLRTTITESLARWVRDGKPLTVTVHLEPQVLRTAPITTPTRYPERINQVIAGDYSVTDADGFVLDWDKFAFPVNEVGYSRLEAYHRTGDYIAKQLVRLHN